jgi:hypothetical protein
MRTLIPILLTCAATAAATPSCFADLAAYAGALPHIAISDTTLIFDRTNAVPFDFGAVSGSSTIEFILKGDPVAGGQAGYLAVGSNSLFSLRYEQWYDTG